MLMWPCRYCSRQIHVHCPRKAFISQISDHLMKPQLNLMPILLDQLEPIFKLLNHGLWCCDVFVKIMSIHFLIRVFQKLKSCKSYLIFFVSRVYNLILCPHIVRAEFFRSFCVVLRIFVHVVHYPLVGMYLCSFLVSNGRQTWSFFCSLKVWQKVPKHT